MLRKALGINQKLGRLEAMALDYGNLGVICHARGDLDGALVLLREVERICRQLSNVQGLTTSLTNQAATLLQLGHTREALPLAEEAQQLAARHGYAVLAKQIEPILERVRQAAEETQDKR